MAREGSHLSYTDPIPVLSCLIKKVGRDDLGKNNRGWQPIPHRPHYPLPVLTFPFSSLLDNQNTSLVLAFPTANLTIQPTYPVRSPEAGSRWHASEIRSVLLSYTDIYSYHYGHNFRIKMEFRI